MCHQNTFLWPHYHSRKQNKFLSIIWNGFVRCEHMKREGGNEAHIVLYVECLSTAVSIEKICAQKVSNLFRASKTNEKQTTTVAYKQAKQQQNADIKRREEFTAQCSLLLTALKKKRSSFNGNFEVNFASWWAYKNTILRDPLSTSSECISAH